MYKLSNYCRLCNNKNINIVFTLGSIPLGEKYFYEKKNALKAPKYPLTIGHCKICKNVQVMEVINPKILWRNYTYISGQTKAIKNHFKHFAQKTIKKFKLDKNDLVIDIGSNDGSLLKFFKEKKINILGIDPASNITKIANKNGIRTLTSLFNKKVTLKIKKNYKKAKIITAFNVFAHTENLKDMLNCIKSVLDDKGIFIFEVQYLGDVIKKNILGTFFHEHMYQHSITSLNNFF